MATRLDDGFGTTGRRAVSEPAARVRVVDAARPWLWLAAGWRDMMMAPQVGLICGALAAGAGWALAAGLERAGAFPLIVPFAAGFLLVAPVLAAGLYEASRRLGRGEPVGFGAIFQGLRRNQRHLAYMGAALTLNFVAWLRVSVLLYEAWFSRDPPGVARLLEPGFVTGLALPFLAAELLVGLVFAVIAFALAAISVPMLVDQPVDSLTAVTTSFRAVRLNPGPMALWALLIVVFTGLGLATLFVGLVVTAPLIGHASWHAYRDLVMIKEARDSVARAGTRRNR